jgi:hypothetical protein
MYSLIRTQMFSSTRRVAMQIIPDGLSIQSSTECIRSSSGK